MFLIFLISGGTLLFSLLSYAAATTVVVRTAARWLPREGDESGFRKTVAVMTMVTLATGVMHLLEISLWAIVFVLCGAITTFETAFYFSAVNYTALGYGDLILSSPWRILGPLEAINGLLLIGLSTAGMFVVLNRMITNRLWREAQVIAPGENCRATKDHVASAISK
jgi:hypothetical protein